VPGSDEHIDVSSVTDVVIQDEVFFNDFEGSGRTNGNDTSSFVLVGEDGQPFHEAPRRETQPALGAGKLKLRWLVLTLPSDAVGGNGLLQLDAGGEVEELRTDNNPSGVTVLQPLS
jgi:hypothetical protein